MAAKTTRLFCFLEQRDINEKGQRCDLTDPRKGEREKRLFFFFFPPQDLIGTGKDIQLWRTPNVSYETSQSIFFIGRMTQKQRRLGRVLRQSNAGVVASSSGCRRSGSPCYSEANVHVECARVLPLRGGAWRSSTGNQVRGPRRPLRKWAFMALMAIARDHVGHVQLHF